MTDIRRMDLTGVGSGPMGPSTAGPGDTPFSNVIGNVFVAEDGPHGSYMSVQQQAAEAANGEWILPADLTTPCGGRVEVTHPGVASLSWTVVLAAPAGGGFGWRIDSSGPAKLRIRDNLNAQLGAESTTTFAAGTRYRLEWSISATNAEVRIFLGDDVNSTETMTRAGAFGPVGVLKFGPTTSSPTVPTFAMDSVLVNDDGTFPGPWTAPVGRYDFRVDWDNNDSFEDPGDDVTARMLGVRATPSMTYGRDQARSLSPTTSGRMSGLELDNVSRDYTPDNASSPLAGLVKPGRQMWVSYNERANLVPNPSFEVDTVGWVSGRATLARTTGAFLFGAASLWATITSVTGTPTVDGVRFPVKPGETYTVSAYDRLGIAGTRSVGVKLIFLNSAGTIVLNPTTVFTSSGGGAWVRRSGTHVAPATATQATVVIAYSLTDAAINDIHQIDGVMVEEGTILGSYFDGSQSGAFWRTTAHKSASLIGTVLFRGHLEDFELNPDINNRSVTVGGLDGLAKLREATVSTELFSGIRTGTAVNEVLDAIGWPVNLRDIDRGGSVLPWWWEEGTDAYSALERLVHAEGPSALVTMGSGGEVIFRDRHHRLLRASSISSQATFRDEPGSDGLRLTGNANSRASTPDNAALDITGDIDIRVRCSADNWRPTVPGPSYTFVGKGGTVGQYAYVFWLTTQDGHLQFQWSADGTNLLAATTLVPTGFINGTLHWVRATLDVDNGASGRTITFYTSEDGVSWVVLEQIVQATGVTSIFNGNLPVEVGAQGDNTDYFVGTVYQAEVRSGIGGTVVASPNFAAQLAGTTSFGDAQGRVWTVHPPAAITGAAEPKHSAPLGYDAGFGEVVNTVSFDVEERRPTGDLQVVWETEDNFAVVPGSLQAFRTATMPDPVVDAIAPVAGVDYTVESGSGISWFLTRFSGQSIGLIVSNTGGTTAIIQGLRLRARPAAVTQTVKVELDDDASVLEQGPRTYGRDAPFAGVHDALAIAKLVLNQRKQRLPTVTVRVLASPTQQPERFFPAIRRDLSDKVRVLDSESSVDAHFFVEQIEHIVHQVGLQHEVRLACEQIPPVPLDEPTRVFILGSATNGILGTNRLGH